MKLLWIIFQVLKLNGQYQTRLMTEDFCHCKGAYDISSFNSKSAGFIKGYITKHPSTPNIEKKSA